MTLVALVITIIVLVILAGISLNGIFGESGLINSAQKAKENAEIAEETEIVAQIQEEMLEDIIEYLKEAGYINDYRFIEKQVNEYMNLKNMSIQEIKYKLMTKGIERKLIEKYLEEHHEELDEYEKKSIENIKIKKSTQMDEQEIKQYLYKKGYKVEM